jgi:hypothetical protein
MTSKSNLNLIFQTEVSVINGFANFTQFGISDLVDDLIISFKFKLPTGLDAYNIYFLIDMIL